MNTCSSQDVRRWRRQCKADPSVLRYRTHFVTSSGRVLSPRSRDLLQPISPDELHRPVENALSLERAPGIACSGGDFVVDRSWTVVRPGFGGVGVASHILGSG